MYIIMISVSISIVLLVKFLLSERIIKILLLPISNKKIKNKFINMCILYRVNYINSIYDNTIFDKEIWNKIINREELKEDELSYLNKNI